jgi:hypothetical protein
MSYDAMAGKKGVLEGMTGEQLVRLCAACLAHAFAVLRGVIECDVEAEAIEYVDQAIRQLETSTRARTADLQVIQARIASMVPDEPSSTTGGQGWWAILISLCEAYSCAIDASNGVRHAWASLTCSYQAVYDVEMERALRYHPDGLVGDAVDAVEQNSRWCQEEVAFQLKALEAIAAEGS